MAKLAKFIILCFISLTIIACGQELSLSKQDDATVVLVSPKSKLSPQATDDAFPKEITSLAVELRDSSERIVFSQDILNIEGAISINLESGKDYSGTATAMAGEELLYLTDFVIEPLVEGETRKVPISLQPQIDVALNDSQEGLATVSSVFQVTLGDSDGAQIPLKVSGLKNPSVTWYVNDIEGGNDELGTIDENGTYFPPATLPDDTLIVIKAEPNVAPSFAVEKVIEIVEPVVEQQKVALPVSSASPNGGEFSERQLVTLSCSNCVDIYFTTNNDEPTTASQIYEAPILISQDTVLKYFAVDESGNVEAVKTTTYIFQPPVEMPTGLTLTATSNSISASWDFIPGMIYNLSISSEPNAVITGGSAVATSGTTYLITNDGNSLPLESGTQYYVALRTAKVVENQTIYSLPIELSISTDAIEMESLSFSNGTLENCVKSSGKQFVHELTVLSCESMGIDDLDGIQVLTSLKELALGDNGLSDLTFLASLRRLTGLWLANNQIIDVTALRFLSNLEGLELGNNQIVDLSPLSNLSSLQWLSLTDNNLGQLGILAGFGSLNELWLNGNSLNDISALAPLTGLTGLHLGQNAISDISVLSNMPNLEWLVLDNNVVEDISVLVSHTKLVEMRASNNRIVDVSSLFENENLSYVELRDNQELSCNGVDFLDQSIDGGDGQLVGAIQWNICQDIPTIFDFESGSVYGWSSKGITDITGNYYDDSKIFNLACENGALVANAPLVTLPYNPLPGTFWAVDIVSPNLSLETEWQNFAGVSLKVSHPVSEGVIGIQVFIKATNLSSGQEEELSDIDNLVLLPGDGSWLNIDATGFGVDFNTYTINNIIIRVIGYQPDGAAEINFDDITLIPGPG